jgi:hypothetical protein
VYKAFQGASKLCIGEKKGNIAYLYVVYGDASYWLIGYPDAGRSDHLPKLKIRDSRRRRLNDAAKKNDKYEKYLGEYVVVRFRDGPGITNTLWEIFEDGSDHISPYAKWYKTGNDDVLAAACVNSGGTVGSQSCCETASAFPNTCLAGGSCGCAPDSSKMVKVCNCPAGECFDGTACVAVQNLPSLSF